MRNLTDITEKQLETMGIIYDIEKDAFFKKGQKQGENKKARMVVINLLKTNKLSIGEIAEVSGLSLEGIQEIAREIK